MLYSSMADQKLKELKEELDWYENTPFYIGRDGMPSMVIIFFGWFYALVYKYYKLHMLKREIGKLESGIIQ